MEKIREPSAKFFDFARDLVLVRPELSKLPRNIVRVSILTDDDLLARAIPPRLPGTLYTACTNLEPGQSVVFEPPEVPALDRIYHEAALGLMDNCTLRDSV